MHELVKATIVAASLVFLGWGAHRALERELQRRHLVRVCEPGATQSGRKAGLHYGAWTHRVKGLDRNSSKGDKIKACKAYGFNPEN